MGNKSSTFKPLREHMLRNDSSRSAILLGATGATGRYLLAHLLTSTEWGKVTVIHRRSIDLSTISTQTNQKFTDEQKSKYKEHIIEMSEIGLEKHQDLFKEHDVVFCCLGTTRAVAKTAEGFRKVDLYMVRDSAKNAKSAGVLHYSLLTSAGSNANVPANDWKASHGLLYLKVKGQAETEVINLKFHRTSIFRPGVLDRGTKSWMASMSGGLPVEQLARCMIFDAETKLIENMKEIEKPVVYDDTSIRGCFEYLSKGVKQEIKGNDSEKKEEEEVTHQDDVKNDENQQDKHVDEPEQGVDKDDNAENVKDQDGHDDKVKD